jgi:hypothetical protein
MAKYVNVFNLHGQKQLLAPTHAVTLLSLWLVPFCPLPSQHGQKQLPAPNAHCHPPFSLFGTFLTLTQPIWPETTTCTNTHCYSPFSVVGTFLHHSPTNMARNNYLHQHTLPLSFLCGWYLSAPLPRQHGQKQPPVPTHTDTLLSL